MSSNIIRKCGETEMENESLTVNQATGLPMSQSKEIQFNQLSMYARSNSISSQGNGRRSSKRSFSTQRQQMTEVGKALEEASQVKEDIETIPDDIVYPADMFSRKMNINGENNLNSHVYKGETEPTLINNTDRSNLITIDSKLSSKYESNVNSDILSSKKKSSAIGGSRKVSISIPSNTEHTRTSLSTMTPTLNPRGEYPESTTSASSRRRLSTYSQHQQELDKPNNHILAKNYSISLCMSLFIAFSIWGLIKIVDIMPWEELRWNTRSLSPEGIVEEQKLSFSRTMYTIYTSLSYVIFLPGYTMVRFWATYGKQALKKKRMFLVCALDMILILLIYLALWASGIHFWFYYLDMIILIVTYSIAAFASGYYAPDNQDEEKPFLLGSRRSPSNQYSTPTDSNRISFSPDSPAPLLPSNRNLKANKDDLQKRKILEGVEVTFTECVVSGAALLYSVFFMPMFHYLDSSLLKIVWRLTVHPIYMELGLKALTRQLLVKKAGKDLTVVHSLLMAHAQAHVVVMQASMVAALTDLTNVIITVVILQFGRLFWRSTAILRYQLFSDLYRKILAFFGKSLNKLDDDQIKMAALTIDKYKFLFAIEVQVEMLMENAANGFALYMAWSLADVDLFLFRVKSDIGYNFLFSAMAIQIGFQILADLLFLMVNSRYITKLPFQNTWRDMWAIKWRFFGFLVYAMLCMGFISQIYLMSRVPRAGLCQTMDPCTCILNIGADLCASASELS